MTYNERIKEFFETFDTTGSVYQASLLIPEVVDDAYFDNLKPKQKFYECKKYERKTEIPSSELERKLSELIKENVPKTPIFSYFKRKNAFIDEHKHSVESELKAILEKEEDENEAEFNKSEKEIKIARDAEYKQQYEEELAEYENIFNPSNEWLNENFENYFDKIVKKWNGRPIASGSSVAINKDVNGNNKYSCTIAVDNLTDFYERVPYKYSITAAGNVSQRQKTDKQIEEEYAQNICALAFIHAVCLFNICLDAKEVLISCYLNHIDSTTGNEEAKFLYSVIIPRELVKTFKMENLNTVSALITLEGRADIRKEREIYFIEPIEWNLEYESPSNEVQNEIDIDFRRLNINISFPEQYEQAIALTSSNLASSKDIYKQKVLELGIFNDEFDADNYASGLLNLLLVLTLLKQNGLLFSSENYEHITTAFEEFFGTNSYAMGEIKKLIDYDVFARIERGEDNIPLAPIALIMIKGILFPNGE